MGDANDFAEQPRSGQTRPIDDLIDPTMSDDDLFLAARLDGPQDRLRPPQAGARMRPNVPPPPRAERSNTLERDPNGMLGGVISGIAYRTGIDTALLRILVLIAVWPSVGLLIPIYLILWGVLPEAPQDSALARHRRPRARNRSFSRFFGLALAFVGSIWLVKQLAFASFLVPIGFVALGVWLFWRDRSPEDVGDVPLPFTDSMDPLSTSPEYERYIANKAKRLEQQKRRRNTTIVVTALMATILAVGAASSIYGTDNIRVASMPVEAVSADQMERIDSMVWEDQDPDQAPSVSDGDVYVEASRTSKLRESYVVNDAALTIDLGDADFDSDHTVTITAQDSQVLLIVPESAIVDLTVEVNDGAFVDERVTEHELQTGEALSFVVQGQDSNIQIRNP